MSRCSMLFSFLLLAASQGLAHADWPAFRGPRGDGTAGTLDLPLEWSSTKNVLWKTKLPREGNGSAIVVGKRVFLACADDAKGLGRSLLCFDADTGDPLWARSVDIAEEIPTHKTNLYCGSTPVSDGQRIVVWHSSAGLHCYDLAGERLWSRDLGRFDHMWGYGSSPILVDGKVILWCGPSTKRTFLTGIDLTSGDTLWETEEPIEGDGNRNPDGKYMGTWSTPLAIRNNGQTEILCALPTRLVAYDPTNGKERWSCDGIRGPKGDLAYSSPMVHDKRCVVVGGFNGPAMGLRLGGLGNITQRNRIWRNEKNPQSIGTGIFLNDHVYRSNAGRPSIVDCIRADTGEVVWSGPAGGASWSSMIHADDHLWLTNQEGTTLVFEPNPERFVLLAKNELGERTNATMAVGKRRLYFRTFAHLYCIAKGAD